MPLLQAEALKLSNYDMRRGVIEEIISTDELFQFLPFLRTEGKAYVYIREGSLATVQFIAPNVDIPESASSFQEVSVTLRILAGDVDVDNYLATAHGDLNDQKAIQIALKAKAMARTFSQYMITGDSSTVYNLAPLGGPPSITNIEFDGLDVLATGAMDYNIGTGNGDVLSFDVLDELLDKVLLGADVLMTGKRTLRDFMKLCRALSSVTPDYVKSPSGQNLLAYRGKPFILNDWVAENLTVGTATNQCSSIYAMRLNEGDGVHGLYTGDSAGFVVQEIGQLEKRDATRTRLKWYVALALKATHTLAIMRGLKKL